MEPDKDYIKLEINNFLWTCLPGKTPLEEAERIAVKIYEMWLQAEKEFGVQE
jgi:hypothetical protein